MTLEPSNEDGGLRSNLDPASRRESLRFGSYAGPARGHSRWGRQRKRSAATLLGDDLTQVSENVVPRGSLGISDDVHLKADELRSTENNRNPRCS